MVKCERQNMAPGDEPPGRGGGGGKAIVKSNDWANYLCNQGKGMTPEQRHNDLAAQSLGQSQ